MSEPGPPYGYPQWQPAGAAEEDVMRRPSC